MDNNNITRRGFLKSVGAGTLATAAVLSGCNGAEKGQNAGPLGEVPTDQMSYRSISKTGDKISILGYGCMRFQMKGEGRNQVVDQDSVDELIDYALKHGVNYFDTAPVYLQGQSEAAVGKALARYDRKSFYLATKLSTMSVGGSPKDVYESSLAMYKASLENLQTDYIDYYLLHNIGSIDAFNKRFVESGVLEYMLKEKEAGHIRNLGYSVHCNKETFDYILAQDVQWDFVQIQMNYYDWAIGSARNVEAKYMYEELAKRGIPVVIMEPIQGGRLASVDYSGINELRASKPGSTAASWAFRFCGTFPGVMTVLSGMTYMEHLQENIRTFAPFEPLTDEQTQTLLDTAQFMSKRPMIQCNSCQYCMPCPYGLDIPGIITHYNKCLQEGNIISDPADTEYKKARRAFLIGYDRSVPRLRQANHCSGCQECIPKCPQHIDIPSEMVKINQFAEELKKNSLTL